MSTSSSLRQQFLSLSKVRLLHQVSHLRKKALITLTLNLRLLYFYLSALNVHRPHAPQAKCCETVIKEWNEKLKAAEKRKASYTSILLGFSKAVQMGKKLAMNIHSNYITSSNAAIVKTPHARFCATIYELY